MTTDKLDTSVEKRQVKLQANSEATERWMRKLLRAAHELERLRKERKRLLYPNGRAEKKVRKMTLEEIRERHAASGYEFNDDIPS